MKIIYSLKACGIFLSAVWFAGPGLLSPAFANAYIVDLNSKKVTDLGSDVVANAINDAGQVAGQKSGHAFITGPNGVGMTDLGTLGGAQSWAAGINVAGQVVGWSDTSSGARHAFITDPGGVGMRDLGTGPIIVGAVNASSSASAINNAGQAVGWSEGTIPLDGLPLGFGQHYMHAFITGQNGTEMRDLSGDIEPPYPFTRGMGINAAGQVAGDRHGESGFSRVFVTGQNGVGVTPVDSVDNKLVGFFDYASGINDTGQVIGQSRIFTAMVEEDHAFVTGPNGVGTRDLGTLGGGNSSASGINDAGQVVGGADTAGGGHHAFVANPGNPTMVDLNSLVPPPPGVTFTNASAINNVGQIVTSGVTTIILEPGSYALMLSGLALIGCIVRRKKVSKAAFGLE